MKIIRVLNTNSVLTRDPSGEETVLPGAGIGFKRKPGDDVEESRIETRFVLKAKAHQSRFEELVHSIRKE